MKQLFFSILLLFDVTLLYAQGICDSVFHIEEVSIYGNLPFGKEEAGMKETRIDSLVLLRKISVSLSDLLSENTSIFIKSSGRGALATASFRGTAASHTQVQWNGISVNSPMTGMVDFSLIPVCFVDDLNLRHGAASLADNSGGLGGSINMANKVNWNNRFSVRYSQGVGSYSTFDEFADVSYGSSKLQGRTRAFHSYSANNYTFTNMRRPSIDPNGNFIFPTDTNKNADYLMFGLLQEVYWRISASNVLSVKYWGQLADRAIPTVISYEGDVNSNTSNQIDEDHRVVAELKLHSDNSKISIRGGYSHKNLDYVSKHLIAGAGLYPTVFSQSQQQNYLAQLNYHCNLPNDLSLQTDFSVNYFDVSSIDTVSHQGYSHNRLQTSLFVALSKSFSNRLNLKMMLRQNLDDDRFIPLMPYVGFDFRLIPDAEFVLRGNVSRVYHQPSLNDLYWMPGGNPKLKPEEGVSAELGLAYQNRSLTFGNLSTDLSCYRSDIDSWIAWLPNFKGYWEPVNIKRVLSQGVEFSLKLNGQKQNLHYRFAGTVSYTKSINYGDKSVWGDNSYGKQLVYVPLYSGNMLVYTEYKGFYLTYQFNSFSERFTTSSNEVTERRRLYPYFMNDLYLGKNFVVSKLRLNVEFRVYNLLNERYHSELFRPMPRRHFMLQLSIRY